MTMIRRLFVAAIMAAGLAVFLTAPATASRAKIVGEVLKHFPKITKHRDKIGPGVKFGSDAAEKLRELEANDDSAKPTPPDDATNPSWRVRKPRKEWQKSITRPYEKQGRICVPTATGEQCWNL